MFVLCLDYNKRERFCKGYGKARIVYKSVAVFLCHFYQYATYFLKILKISLGYCIITYKVLICLHTYKMLR